MAQTKRHSAALDKADSLLEDALNIVNSVLAEKQLVFDGRSDRWQAGEKGKEALEELATLEQAAATIEATQEFLNQLRAE